MVRHGAFQIVVVAHEIFVEPSLVVGGQRAVERETRQRYGQEPTYHPTSHTIRGDMSILLEIEEDGPKNRVKILIFDQKK